MSIAAEFTLHQVAVEVRYQRGIVYLDKCGSLMLKLQERLGEPFRESFSPTMSHGELQSPAERIAVQFGPKSINLTHAWPLPPTPVRLEQLAPVVWNDVANTLDVGRSVTRYSARYWLLWKTDTIEEARERVRTAKMISATDAWRAAFGAAEPYGWTAVIDDEHGTLRIGMDAVETNVQGASAPADLVDVAPKYSVLLDLDHFRGPHAESVKAPVFALQKEAYKEFIRSSWQRTKLAATTVGKLLGAKDDGG